MKNKRYKGGINYIVFKCETCIHKENLDVKNEICVNSCKDVFARLNRENSLYQEQLRKPSNCSKCSYLKSYDEYFYCTVFNWDSDEKRTFNKTVRKNYLKKNTPKWCKLK